MRQSRRCSRSGCAQPAAATLTYVYAESTAVVGPLATYSEPHSYDLCEFHAERPTVPPDLPAPPPEPPPIHLFTRPRPSPRRPRGSRARHYQ
ncbi:DUF3499 family protein, partial [Modestobacter marinus]|uniref:DUF3499 family protein n=1 Tax=Modestobacter marinus TaxID=477641 RepID=UPI00201AE6C4